MQKEDEIRGYSLKLITYPRFLFYLCLPNLQRFCGSAGTGAVPIFINFHVSLSPTVKHSYCAESPQATVRIRQGNEIRHKRLFAYSKRPNGRQAPIYPQSNSPNKVGWAHYIKAHFPLKLVAESRVVRKVGRRVVQRTKESNDSKHRFEIKVTRDEQIMAKMLLTQLQQFPKINPKQFGFRFNIRQSNEVTSSII